jgi:transcriptional regulator with XRE-family HTH domain
MESATLLLEARRRAGLTQAELASRAGTTQSAIARLEAGRSSPSLERLTELLLLCGLDLQVRLVPYDDHDWTLAEVNRDKTPTQRLRNMLAVNALRGSMAEDQNRAG